MAARPQWLQDAIAGDHIILKSRKLAGGSAVEVLGCACGDSLRKDITELQFARHCKEV